MAQTKITRSAKGEDCSIRLPGIFNFNPETTILSHFNPIGQGMWITSNDIHAGYSCSNCHDAIDGRMRHEFSPLDIRIATFDAMVETQLKLIAKGLIKIV